MGFKENLKSELTYSGMLVKELATLSKVNKRTIDNYLKNNNSMPLADAAVRIASALGVTVEYLITGNKHEHNPYLPVPSAHVILEYLDTLNKRDKKIVYNLIKSLKEMEDFEKKDR